MERDAYGFCGFGCLMFDGDRARPFGMSMEACELWPLRLLAAADGLALGTSRMFRLRPVVGSVVNG